MTLDYESVASKGSMLGSGGMIILDESRDVVQVLKNLAEFYHDESAVSALLAAKERVGLKKFCTALQKKSSQRRYQTLRRNFFEYDGTNDLRTCRFDCDARPKLSQEISQDFERYLTKIEFE